MCPAPSLKPILDTEPLSKEEASSHEMHASSNEKNTADPALANVSSSLRDNFIRFVARMVTKGRHIHYPPRLLDYVPLWLRPLAIVISVSFLDAIPASLLTITIFDFKVQKQLIRVSI